MKTYLCQKKEWAFILPALPFFPHCCRDICGQSKLEEMSDYTLLISGKRVQKKRDKLS